MELYTSNKFFLYFPQFIFYAGIDITIIDLKYKTTYYFRINVLFQLNLCLEYTRYQFCYLSPDLVVDFNCRCKHRFGNAFVLFCFVNKIQCNQWDEALSAVFHNQIEKRKSDILNVS